MNHDLHLKDTRIVKSFNVFMGADTYENWSMFGLYKVFGVAFSQNFDVICFVFLA